MLPSCSVPQFPNVWLSAAPTLVSWKMFLHEKEHKGGLLMLPRMYDKCTLLHERPESWDDWHPMICASRSQRIQDCSSASVCLNSKAFFFFSFGTEFVISGLLSLRWVEKCCKPVLGSRLLIDNLNEDTEVGSGSQRLLIADLRTEPVRITGEGYLRT